MPVEIMGEFRASGMPFLLSSVLRDERIRALGESSGCPGTLGKNEGPREEPPKDDPPEDALTNLADPETRLQFHSGCDASRVTGLGGKPNPGAAHPLSRNAGGSVERERFQQAPRIYEQSDRASKVSLASQSAALTTTSLFSTISGGPDILGLPIDRPGEVNFTPLESSAIYQEYLLQKRLWLEKGRYRFVSLGRRLGGDLHLAADVLDRNIVRTLSYPFSLPSSYSAALGTNP